MNKRTFNNYLSESNFRELFISEMGWNNPTGATQLPEYTIDEMVFAIEQIADCRGFQILHCEVDEIPTSSICKKLDTKLRKNAEHYILIFSVPGTLHHLWVTPVKKVEKRDLVIIDYDTIDKANFLFEKMEGLSFSFDAQPTILDVIDRVQNAFIINSEKITKDFYAGFKKEHTNFVKFISGIDDQIADKDNKKKQWYTSVMLNRLMFCYFIQKKKFLDGDEHYLRKKLEWTQQEKGENRFFSTFYKGFLVRLFHDGLNAPEHDTEFEKMYGRIPYLNGGMFDIHQIENDYKGLDIADEAFISLFDFFDKWHWHLDDRMTATGKDINPDVLGYIFEQYINDRAKMGAYYTKEDITEYIGRNTILPYLMNEVGKIDPTLFENDSDFWQFFYNSGDKYVYDSLKKGNTYPIPNDIAIGIDTTKPNLMERRQHWNESAPEGIALPTETWREAISRIRYYQSVKSKIQNHEICDIPDFTTYNIDIRQLVYDYLNQTDNTTFIKYFYKGLQNITILDPTCGSGAFLFAALNILEPLYDVCISRMQEFHKQDGLLFAEQINEISNKYRSNIQYFIYKSIILRNLYGVDYMTEATEIAKLRLFLKLVAVVEVDARDKNMGLDPLPDIDFNIRCGNTLVGYATEKELEEGIASTMNKTEEFREEIEKDLQNIKTIYRQFKDIQLSQSDNKNIYKDGLKKQLTGLNKKLNHLLYNATATIPYDKWYSNHLPFHWLSEFYEIINDNGGFDVIIGNPPYVDYDKKDKETGLAVSDLYQISGYDTLPCGDLYAFCVERSLKSLKKKDGAIGMIVPISIVSTDGYYTLRNVLTSFLNGCYFSNYGVRPSKLFDGVDKRLTIFISSLAPCFYNTKYYRWNSIERPVIFKKIKYEKVEKDTLNISGYPKISSNIESKIIEKLSNKRSLGLAFRRSSNFPVRYTRKLQYFIQFFIEPPIIYDEDNNILEPSELKKVCLDSVSEQSLTISFLNSSLFFWFFIAFSDCRNVNAREIINFPVGIDSIKEDYKEEIINLSHDILDNLKSNSVFTHRNDKRAGKLRIQSFQPRLSKPVVDKIDKAIYKHYGFTEEELDFIINYDIKYRMGDELGEE